MKLSPTISLSISFLNTSIFKKYLYPIICAFPYAIPNDIIKLVIELIASQKGCLIKVEYELLGLDEPYSKHKNPKVNINI